MHFLESSASQIPAVIGKPYIRKDVFPLPFDRYITLHPSAGYNSRHYDYWQDVVNLIHPYLFSQNIAIVQIGEGKDAALQKVYHAQGKTTINQMAYLIANGMGNVGPDTCSVHIASGEGTPLVALYSNNWPETCGPYWNSNKQWIVRADLQGNLPSYMPQENPKTINRIPPEEIANAVLEMVGAESNAINSRTVYIGRDYHHKILEAVPNFQCPPNLFVGASINIRADMLKQKMNLSEEKCVAALMSLLPSFCCNNRMVSIILQDTMLDVEFVKNLWLGTDKKLQLVYIIRDCEPPPVEYFAKLRSVCSNLNIFSQNNKEEIGDIRALYYGDDINVMEWDEGKRVEQWNNGNWNWQYKSVINLRSFSNRVLYAAKDNGLSVFSSSAHYLEDELLDSVNGNSVLDTAQFMIERENFKIVEI